MTPSDKLGRVRTMLADDGDTWDLSKKDKAALRHVLGMIDAMASSIMNYTGKPVTEVICIYGERAERCEKAPSS